SALIQLAHVLCRGKTALSMIATERLSLASAVAAVDPLGPAPTTRTSKLSGGIIFPDKSIDSSARIDTCWSSISHRFICDFSVYGLPTTRPPRVVSVCPTGWASDAARLLRRRLHAFFLGGDDSRLSFWPCRRARAQPAKLPSMVDFVTKHMEPLEVV